MIASDPKGMTVKKQKSKKLSKKIEDVMKKYYQSGEQQWQDNYKKFEKITKDLIDKDIDFMINIMNFNLDVLKKKNVWTKVMNGKE